MSGIQKCVRKRVSPTDRYRVEKSQKPYEKQLVLWAGGLKLGFMSFCDL